MIATKHLPHAIVISWMAFLLIAGPAAAQDAPVPVPADPDAPPAEAPVTPSPEAPVIPPPTSTPNPAVTAQTNAVDALRRSMRQSITNRPARATATNLAFPAFPTPGRRTVPPGRPGSNPAGGPPGFAGPGDAGTNVIQTATIRTNNLGEIGEVVLKFNNAPLEQVLEEYARITGRTVLRPANLQSQITIITSTPLTREEAIQAMDGALALNNITMIPQGEKFVKAVPAAEAMKEGARIVSLGDGEFPEAEQFVTHIVQLEIAQPSEVAQMLTSFTKNPAGIVAIDSSQILVLRDYASNIRRMLELIDQVDVTPENDYRLEVIPIKYGKVTDLYDTMNALITGSGGGGFTRSGTQQQQRRAGGLPSAGTPSQFGAGNRYNRASQGMNNQFNNQLNPLAAQQQQLGGTQTGQGGSFQQRLNQIVNRAAGESQIQVLGDARIVPDERSNSLIVYASKQDVQMITNIVSKVDVLLAQVLIEGIVLAVNLGDELEIGVSWLQNPKRFGQDFAGAGGINNGQNFLGNLTNLTSGLPSGFSYFGKIGNDVEVALTAIAADKKARVLQRPRIQTSHAVPGSFFTGQTVPYVTGVYNFGGIGSVGTQSTVQQLSVGSTLQVTPYITPDGLVVLDIYQDLSQVEGFTKIDNNDVPTTSSRNAEATLSVRDGDTIMLGGYIQESKENATSGVPLLKDIPGLGALFRSKSSKFNRQEVMLFLQVTVLKTPSDAGAQAKIERDRLPGIFEAFKDIESEEAQSKKKAGMIQRTR